MEGSSIQSEIARQTHLKLGLNKMEIQALRRCGFRRVCLVGLKREVGRIFKDI